MSRDLVIARVFPPQVGGSGRFLCEIYRRQPPESFVVAAGHYSGSVEFDQACGFSVERLPLHVTDWGLLPTGFVNYAKLYFRLRRLAKREGATAVHAATLLPEGFLARLIGRSLGVPYLCFVHGEELVVAATSRQLRWMAQRVLEGAGRVIANSNNSRNLLLRDWSVPPGKVVVITPGVDIERFRPAHHDEAARARLGWQGRRVVLTAGRLQERKGHDHLIRALPSVREAIPDVLYAIAGDGDRRRFLDALTTRLGLQGCVQFLGELTEDELIQCYQQCELLALPNRTVNGDFEGFGMVLVEAQACGRPVLAGNSGGTAETMHEGETGRVVSCERPEPLADALVDLLSRPDRLNEMGAAAHQWIMNRFDWKLLAEQARVVFEDVDGEKRAAPETGEQINTAVYMPPIGRLGGNS